MFYYIFFLLIEEKIRLTTGQAGVLPAQLRGGPPARIHGQKSIPGKSMEYAAHLWKKIGIF